MGTGREEQRVRMTRAGKGRRKGLPCYPKFQHESKGTAEIHIESMRADGIAEENRHKVLHAYQCPYCNQWHVGHILRWKLVLEMKI